MLGVGANLIKSAYSRGLAYVRDGLKLYMPYRGSHSDEVQFVGTGSTSFDGVNDWIDCGTTLGDILGDGYAGALTISLWFKTNNFDDVGGLVAFSPMDGGGDDDSIVIRHSTSEIIFRTRGTGGAEDTSNIAFSAVDTWTHVVAIYDGTKSANNQFLYVNGILKETNSQDEALDLDGIKLVFGSYYNVGYKNLDGYMKNVAIWNRVLTATEIQNVMYKTYDEVGGRLANGLVSWWGLDAISSLGSELWDADASVFTSGIYGWGVEGNNTIANVGNALTITYVDSASGARVDLSDAEDLSANLTATKVYQLTFDASYSGGSSGVRLRVYDNSAYNYSDIFTTSTASYSVSFEAGHATGCFILLEFLVSGQVVTLDNLSLKEVQAKDLKGSNDGTITGATIDEDLYGGDTPVKPRAIDNAPTVQADAIGAGSASFGVVADIITTGFNAADELTNANTSFSVLFWATGGQNGSDKTYLVGDGTIVPGRFYMRIESDNTNLRMSVGGSYDTLTTSNPYDSSQWNHCAFIYDASGNTGKIYVNGIQEISVAVSDSDAYPDQSVVLGHNNGGNSFIGKMSQLGIWDAALDQAQIQSIMEKTYDELTSTEKTNLVSYWPLDADGTDSHGDNDGTLA